MTATPHPVPSGATRVAAVVGDPIEHSRSPAIYNAAFGAADLDWVYVAFRAVDGRRAVDAVRALRLGGLNVTMPFKEEAAAACDQLTPLARRLGVVNTIVPRGDGSVLGDSTDGPGLLAALREEDVDVTGRATLVLGSGGAARAVALSLADAGARVTVAARRERASEEVAALAGAAVAGWADRDRAAADSEIVVHATPIGMGGQGTPVAPSAWHPGHVVVDLVYEPTETELLAAARAAGARTVGGLGMLVHQAALAFERFTGHDAPLAKMWAAVGGSRGGSGG